MDRIRSFVRVIFTLLFSFVSIGLSAERVSKETALRKIDNFLYGDSNNKSLKDVHINLDTSIVETISIAGIADLYKAEFDNMWFLLSTHSAVKPILAYSLSGEFPNKEDMPEGMKWLLSYYEQIISYAQDSMSMVDNWATRDKKTLSELSGETVCLGKLVQNAWGQSLNNSQNCINSYNKFCPTFHSVACGRTIVGCGAVALGQVLWYYQWPHCAYIPKYMLNDSGTISTEKEYKFYDWDLMPDSILNFTPDTMANMTALLLKDCGYAENMEYGSSGSTTYLSNIRNALVNNFNYSAVSLYRNSYSGNWIDKMKQEIQNGRPVIYRGGGPTGGHFFVLYGFQDDRFNINWGWKGNSNGLFALDSLYVNGTNYNSEHWAIVNIAPVYLDCNPKTIHTIEIWQKQFCCSKWWRFNNRKQDYHEQSTRGYIFWRLCPTN